jgi:hypothetical protein
MSGWDCAIDGCGRVFDGVEETIFHQVSEHERHECAVCGAVVPAGYFAIRHVLGEHSRAEYVRHYDADSDAIRAREDLLAAVNEQVDVAALRERLEGANAPGD